MLHTFISYICYIILFLLYRESIALSAGWALGLILLCKGCNSHTSHTTATSNHTATNTGTNPPLSNNTPPSTSAASSENPPLSNNNTASTSLSGLADLHIEDRLYTLITGGKRPDVLNTYTNSTNIYNTTATSSMSSNIHDSSSKSSRVLEGDFLNVDVTAVGATIALSLIFMRYVYIYYSTVRAMRAAMICFIYVYVFVTYFRYVDIFHTFRHIIYIHYNAHYIYILTYILTLSSYTFTPLLSGRITRTWPGESHYLPHRCT